MNIMFKRSLILLTNHLSRSFSKAESLKNVQTLYSRYKNLLFVSAASFGLSAYILKKNKIKCDIDEHKNELIDIEIPNNLNLRQDHNYEEAILKSRDLLRRVKDEVGAPGIVVGVSIDGKTVWTEGLGYADIENRVLCSANTVMRIASISKSITMAAVGKLWEQGKLDLDKSVQDYVPSFPQKTFDGKPVVITCRQLLSHMAGIRHYSKNVTQNNIDSKCNEKNKKEEKGEFDFLEYYIKEKYDVKSSLNLFKDDPLIAKPGTKFYYTTHGWTLISAIVEAVSKEEFPRHLNKLFKALGMRNTYFDENDNIIYHRSRNYKKNKKGHLINAPYVDNSYKWAGGGILSTVSDLLQFGNAMLYSYQFKDTPSEKEYVTCNSVEKDNTGHLNQKEKLLPGYLKSKTVETIWTPVVNVNDHSKYAMGWLTLPEKHECQYCEKVKFCVYHTGGAIGASSILLIMPESLSTNITGVEDSPPKGVVVAILTNLMPVNLTNTAIKIAEFFDNR